MVLHSYADNSALAAISAAANAAASAAAATATAECASRVPPWSGKISILSAIWRCLQRARTYICST